MAKVRVMDLVLAKCVLARLQCSALRCGWEQHGKMGLGVVVGAHTARAVGFLAK